MITKYITGDITQTELKYIAHGVNCQNKMGSGVAKALYEAFPEVKTEYHKFCTNKARLGDTNIVLCADDRLIVNCFTQDNYGYDGKRYVNYRAVVECFQTLVVWAPLYGTLAIPKIGCGLAGGDWNFMEQLINDTVGDKLEIWVYELEEKKYSRQNGDNG